MTMRIGPRPVRRESPPLPGLALVTKNRHGMRRLGGLLRHGRGGEEQHYCRREDVFYLFHG